MPPSTTTSTTVTYELSLDAGNSATFATSSGRPRRPNSVLPGMAAAHSGSFNCSRVWLVSIRPGDRGFADLTGSYKVLSRAGLWSRPPPSFAWCLGAIGLRLDYGQATGVTDVASTLVARPRRADIAHLVVRIRRLHHGSDASRARKCSGTQPQN